MRSRTATRWSSRSRACATRTGSSAPKSSVSRARCWHGPRAGDRVGIWSPNCAEWVVLQYATAAVGVILVNINPAYRDARARLRRGAVRVPRAVRRDRVQDERLPRHGRRGRARPRRHSSRSCSSVRPTGTPSSARADEVDADAVARGRPSSTSTIRSTSSTRAARPASRRARRSATTTS